MWLAAMVSAIAAAIVVGMVRSLTSVYVGVAWENISYFVLFLVVLIVRPAGLAGIKGAEELGHV